MQTIKLLAVVATMALTALGATEHTSSPCRQDTGSSARMLSNYRNIAVINDSSLNAWRQSAGLTAIDSNQVTLVSDTTTCRTALIAYNAALQPDTLQSEAVDVIRYGSTRYVVADSARIGGQWTPNVIFDSFFSQVISKVSQ